MWWLRCFASSSGLPFQGVLVAMLVACSLKRCLGLSSSSSLWLTAQGYSLFRGPCAQGLIVLLQTQPNLWAPDGLSCPHREPCKHRILLTLRTCAWPILGLLRAQQQAFPLTVWWTPKSLLPLDLNPETGKTQRKGQPRLCGGWGSGRFVTLEGVLIWKLPLALIQSQQKWSDRH